jgi:hypothetical protein
MKECHSIFSEYKSLAPMYTFEFWLETLSKSSIKSTVSLLNESKENDDDEEEESCRTGGKCGLDDLKVSREIKENPSALPHRTIRNPSPL